MTLPIAYELFTPNKSGQRLHPLDYRCCWHRVSRCLFSKKITSWQKKFTTRRPSSFTRRRGVRLSSIAHDSRLLPPVGVWSVSQYHSGGTRSHAPYPS